jgi:hypothetical protein
MAEWAAISILAVNAWVGVCNRPAAHFGRLPETTGCKGKENYPSK